MGVARLDDGDGEAGPAPPPPTTTGGAGEVVAEGVVAGVSFLGAAGLLPTPALSGLVHWPVAGLFIAGGVAGGALGLRAAVRLADRKGMLTRVFAGVIFAVAAYMLYRSAGTFSALWGGA